MRIAHVTATFPPYRNGTANVCYHNAVELARRGHDVHVFTPSYPGAPAYETEDNIAVHRLRPLLRLGNGSFHPQLLGVLRHFDVIHLHYPFLGGELSALAAWLYRTPLVITYHQDVMLPGALGAVERVLRLTAGRGALRAAVRVCFTSLDYGEASYARGLLRGREWAIDELPNGVDPLAFMPGEPLADLRAGVGLCDGDQVVLLVAALDRAHYFKGVPVLLQALVALPECVKAIMVGDGNLRGEYEQAAMRLGLASRVFFAGRVPDRALASYYQLADVTVLPSTTMGEAFGLVLVESLACGTPVIATDLPGVRTVVANGQDGLLARPGDPGDLAETIGRLLADPRRLPAMGRQGREKVVARYAWPAIGERLEQLYRSVLPVTAGAALNAGR